jgi:hypothetical protein
MSSAAAHPDAHSPFIVGGALHPTERRTHGKPGPSALGKKFPILSPFRSRRDFENEENAAFFARPDRRLQGLANEMRLP